MKKVKELRNEVLAKIEEDLLSYEQANSQRFLRNVPIIVRIDGKNFKLTTKGLNKPFDDRFSNVMKETMIALCRTVRGVVMGYTISDEIDLLIYDNSLYWYNLDVQGFVASIASLATGYFNRYYNDEITFADGKKRIGFFDVVAFNVPQIHVSDYFIKKQNFEARQILETVCKSNGISLGSKPTSSFELKKKLYNLRELDYDKDVATYDRIGICATINDSNDYVAMKETPNFDEQMTFINSLLDVPFFDIEMEV